jgi:hypothetical protein
MTTQLSIDFSRPVCFSGLTFSERHDSARLTGQLLKVYELMMDGKWRTLAEIQAHVGGSEAGISARLRDLRKQRFGGFTVNHRRRGEPKSGLFEYQVKERI